MSLQLIHTSAEHLLDSGQPGYGTVARSEVMPGEMRRKLTELSRYRTVPGKRANEVQCSYTTMAHANTEYHVLSVSQPAGADYSGRMCHISHHLVLLPEEVAILMRSKHRPTPAGIILALGLSGFWCKRWDSPPSFIKGEPHLSPEDIPNASTQATWKRLTGHKSNARAFNTSPFERDCLMTVPEGTSFIDILKLWHESDWLMPLCGWGKTFITHADESDNFRMTQRWACDEQSPLIRKALRTGHPVIPIGADLEIGELSNETQAATSEEQKQFRARLAARQAARNLPPYQYSEEPDEEIFDLSDIRRRKARRLVVTITAATLLFGGGIIGGTVYHINRTPASIGGNMAFRTLRALLSKPYQATYAAQELKKAETLALASRSASGVQNKAVIQIVDILQQASESEKHATNLRQLCRLATQWRLDKSRLCLLYMNEATHNRPTQEWYLSFSREELNEWERLVADEPELRQGLNDPKLLAYFDKVMDKQIAAEPPTKQDSPGSATSCCEGKFFPVVMNDELPKEFIRLLQSAPSTLSRGELLIIRKPDQLHSDALQKILLHPETCVCNIVRSAAADFYHLRFADPTGGTERTHRDIDLCVRQNRPVSISCGGAPVIVCLPLASSSSVLIVPKFSIPLNGLHLPELPPAENIDLTITPDQLEILPPSTSHMAVSLKLNPGGSFPWNNAVGGGKSQRFSFLLPHFNKGMSIPAPDVSPSSPVPIKWDGVAMKQVDDIFTSVTCTLTPQQNIKEELLRTFHKIANSGCAGEVSDADPMFSLSMVYATLRLMDKKDMTEQEWDSAASRYCTLFNNKTFSELMLRISPASRAVLLSYEDASARSAAGKAARRKVLKRLRKEEYRQQLRADILDYISRKLRESYRDMQAQSSSDTGVKLILRHLSCENNQLIWHFMLQPTENMRSNAPNP